MNRTCLRTIWHINHVVRDNDSHIFSVCLHKRVSSFFHVAVSTLVSLLSSDERVWITLVSTTGLSVLSEETVFFVKCKRGETTQNGCKVRCAQGRDLFSLGSDLSSRRLCAERNVTVMSTVSGCDVTTVQQHYTGSTSTPARVREAVSDSRSVPSLH